MPSTLSMLSTPSVPRVVNVSSVLSTPSMAIILACFHNSTCCGTLRNNWLQIPLAHTSCSQLGLVLLLLLLLLVMPKLFELGLRLVLLLVLLVLLLLLLMLLHRHALHALLLLLLLLSPLVMMLLQQLLFLLLLITQGMPVVTADATVSACCEDFITIHSHAGHRFGMLLPKNG